MARDHARHGHDGAALRHGQAAEAHEVAMATPLDKKLARAAMRASGRPTRQPARPGVRPLLPWPAARLPVDAGRGARHRVLAGRGGLMEQTTILSRLRNGGYR